MEVGFELKFSGITLDETADAVRSALGGEFRSEAPAARVLDVESLGRFKIELDWTFLKRKADEIERGEASREWIEQLSRVAAILVPVEVGCPPIPMGELASLEPLVASLREAGAVAPRALPVCRSLACGGIRSISSTFHLSSPCSAGSCAARRDRPSFKGRIMRRIAGR